MKKLMIFVLFFGLTVTSYATLTNQQIPVTKNGAASPPTLQNGSITDTGTSAGAGNVGINQGSPGQRLDVSGTVRASYFIASQGGPSSGYVLTATDSAGDSNWQVLSAGSGTVSSGTIGQEAYYTGSTTVGSGVMTDTGANVGVGSTSPGQKLDVWGTVRILNGGHLTVEGVTSTGATGTGNLVFGTSPTFVTPILGTPTSGVATNLTGTASGLTAGTVTTNANLTGVITSSGNATSIASQTGTGTTFVTQSGNPNFLGNVGIGSATPGATLDIQGTLRVINGTNPTLLNTTGGNVGIGTTLPDALFDVGGNCKGRAGIVSCWSTNNGGAGYCSGSVSGTGCTCTAC